MDLSFYLRVFLRRIHYVLLFLVLGAGIGGALAVLLPPVYRSEARLVVEAEQMPGNLAESTVQVEATEQLEIIRQRILTRETLIDMANRLDIYGAEGAARRPADEIVQDLRDRISIATTGGGQSRTGPAQATIVTVSFEAPTAALASTVANEVVTLILQENVAMRTRVAGQTLDFFEQEVDRLDGELQSKGATIQAFQEANRDALPDSLEFRRGQLVSTQERMLQMDRDEAALRDRRARLVQIYEETGGVGPVPDQQRTPEQRQLEDLRNQLSSALAVLAPSNPRVRLLQGQVDALQATVDAQAGATAGDTASLGLSAYDIQLADIDAQIDTIRADRERLQAGMDEIQASISATPGNAIALDTMQRDYAALRAQYDQAVQNRARAETGEQIEALSRGQRISIIEQATPPQEPLSPNRPLVAAAGVGGGLGFGLGLVALLEVLNRSIRRPVEITRGLGISPFAALPLVRSRREIRRRRLVILGAFAVVLIGIPGALWLVDTRVMPLDVLMDRALARLSALT